MTAAKVAAIFEKAKTAAEKAVGEEGRERRGRGQKIILILQEIHKNLQDFYNLSRRENDVVSHRARRRPDVGRELS